MNERLMYKGHHIEESSFYGKSLKDCSRKEILELVVYLLKEKDDIEQTHKRIDMHLKQLKQRIL